MVWCREERQRDYRVWEKQQVNEVSQYILAKSFHAETHWTFDKFIFPRMTEDVLNKCVVDHFLTRRVWGVGRYYIYYVMQGSGISNPWELKHWILKSQMSHIYKHHDWPFLSNLSSAHGEVFAKLLRPHFSHSSVFVHHELPSLTLSSPSWIVSSVRSFLKYVQRQPRPLLVRTFPFFTQSKATASQQQVL